MAKLTLLEITQSILSSLSGDEVNSISDTTESMQVAEIVKTTYYNILPRANLTSDTVLIHLDASTDITTPVLMFKPDDVDKIEWIKYYDTSIQSSSNNDYIHDLNVDITGQSGDSVSSSPNFKYVTILPNTQFLEIVNGFNTDADNVESFVLTINNDTFNINYKNDVQPRYCTVFRNFYIVFDAYDISQDDTLQASKTMCLGAVSSVFRMQDNFIPALDESLFPLLLNEAKALAFFELKQMVHPKAEHEARRQWGTLQRTKSLVNQPTNFQQLPDFGRRKLRWR